MKKDTELTKIGVFYDGNYFLHVSNYYNYIHSRRNRLSISGMHDFIRSQIAEEESTDVRLCQVVDAHYFRGRLNAQEASQKSNQLYNDRVFDDILMSEGVTTHYLPLRSKNGKREEKGIDVWLALEALELAIFKKYDVLVLIASDGDYVPLCRKLNTIGTRVMVLSWDFEYTDDNGILRSTRTSQDLLEEVSYPIAMHELIDNRLKRTDIQITRLFVQNDTTPRITPVEQFEGTPTKSTILTLKNGFGFIQAPPNNLFFHHSDLTEGSEFNNLHEGDWVEFVIGKNTQGEPVAKNVRHLDTTTM